MTPQNNPDPSQKKYIIAIPLLFLLAVCFYAVAALITGGPVDPENAAAATKIVCAEPVEFGTPGGPHEETTPVQSGGGQRGNSPSGGIPVEFQPRDTSPLETLPEEKPLLKNLPTEIQENVEPIVEILPLENNASAEHIVRNRFVRPQRFLTDVCLTHDGALWVTAEAGGVYRLGDPETDREWEDMRAQPGFPATSNCTAVCEDSQGRIWVGTASMGVQVFAGGKWRRYDRDSVLGGSHVHDLASSASGLVAVAHEGGVSVYDSKRDSWRDYTFLDGLPSCGVRGVCFEGNDLLHCAMESGGYARIDVRDAADEHAVSCLTAPETWGEERAALFPLMESGTGLGSNFCNGITVDDTGRVCIAGLNGISYGKDGDFRFLQGRDLKAKMDGAARKELIELVDLRGTDTALKESYVTCVLHGKYGLWIGYRTQGVEQRASGDPKIIRDYSFPRINSPVRGFVELPDGRVFAATYGGGLVKLIKFDPVDTPSATVRQTADAAHPSYRTVNPVSVLRNIRRFVRVRENRPECWAQYLGEDWVTKGDWCGRYGARKQVLCAMNAPSSTRPWDGGVSNSQIFVAGGIGPHRNPNGDGRKSWVDWERADDNRDVLLQMEDGHRTQSEWNDNGQEHPRTFEGPDLWLMIRPEQESAVWRFSMYFFNSNGRSGNNVERDYIIEVYESSMGESVADCMKKKPLCTARVADFASGGVYKTFLLRNSSRPGMCFQVRLVRYGSLNVILNGIFFDRLFEAQDVRKVPEYERIAEQGDYRAPRWYDCGCEELEETAGLFLDRYFDAGGSTRGIGTMPQLRLAFYRYVRTNLPSNRNLAERLRWDAAIWTDADRAEFDAAMRKYAEERRAAGTSK